jgi:hypothetical protein
MLQDLYGRVSDVLYKAGFPAVEHSGYSTTFGQTRNCNRSGFMVEIIDTARVAIGYIRRPGEPGNQFTPFFPKAQPALTRALGRDYHIVRSSYRNIQVLIVTELSRVPLAATLQQIKTALHQAGGYTHSQPGRPAGYLLRAPSGSEVVEVRFTMRGSGTPIPLADMEQCVHHDFWRLSEPVLKATFGRHVSFEGEDKRRCARVKIRA